MAEKASKAFNPESLTLLRCPVSHAELTFVRDYWLVCEANGYKYPIYDGIPMMLVNIGEQWKDTAIDDLPVPPPPAGPNPVNQI